MSAETEVTLQKIRDLLDMEDREVRRSYPPGHRGAGEHHFVLDDYQVANLHALLAAAMNGDETPVKRFYTGDWASELFYLTMGLTELKPNHVWRE